MKQSTFFPVWLWLCKRILKEKSITVAVENLNVIALELLQLDHNNTIYLVKELFTMRLLQHKTLFNESSIKK